MDTNGPTSDDTGITWDYLRDNPAGITVDTLIEAGTESLFDAFNNFYMSFSGTRQRLLDQYIKIINEIEAQETRTENDENYLSKFKAHRDRNSAIISAQNEIIDSIVEKGGISPAEKDLFTSYDFLYNQVIGAKFSALQSGEISDPNIVKAVEFTLELYRQMRARGFDHGSLCV